MSFAVRPMFSAKAASNKAWNPAQAGTGVVISNAGLTALTPNNRSALANIGVTSGKYYWEIVTHSSLNGNIVAIGIANAAINKNAALASTPFAVVYSSQGPGPIIYETGGTENISPELWDVEPQPGTVVGIALDATNKIVTFYANGVPQGDWEFTTVTTYYPVVGNRLADAGGASFTANFSEDSWVYSPPSGYEELPNA
jgi:hypothetical protein